MKLEKYLEELTNRYFGTLDKDAVSLFIGGSYCQDDFRKNSDLDVYAFCRSSTLKRKIEQLIEKIKNEALLVPAKGLEFHLIQYPVKVERNPSFLLVLSDGQDWEFEAEYDYKTGENLIGLSIVQKSGRLLRGKDIRQEIPKIPKEWISEEAKKVISWHRTKVHDPFHDPYADQAVLNSCRALYYIQSGEFLSKSGGGVWYLENFDQFSELVSEAVQARCSNPVKLPKEKVLQFLDYLESQL